MNYDQDSATKAEIPKIFGHPKGLFYLFFAEMWERFSFYGMRALLILYMTTQLLYSDNMSFGIYAAYGSLVYVTPIIGGMLADKILGYRKAIILGGMLMTIGHICMSIETPLFFYGSLAIIIVGNGFFKPNISSLVGTLYNGDDGKMESGFTIFYLGINLGGWAAPLLCAWLAAAYGWHYGFGLAGIGMITGLITFKLGIKNNVFGNNGMIPDPIYFHKKVLGFNKEQIITIGSFLAVPIFGLIIYFYEFEHYLVWVFSFVLIIILVNILMSVSKVERDRLLIAVYFTILMSLFWAIFEQGGSSLTLFASRNVNLVGMNASQTNSINSGFIILLAIPFSWLWGYLGRIKKNPSSPIKFGLGLIILGVGFVTFAFSANSVDEFAKTPMFYIVMGYFVVTVGEMFISPIGLSKMTELSPLKYAGFIMGVWFVASFYGHFFSGQIAKLTSAETDTTWVSEGVIGKTIEFIVGLSRDSAIQMGPAFEQLYSYVSIYALFGVLTVIIGCIAILIAPFISRMMHDVH